MIQHRTPEWGRATDSGSSWLLLMVWGLGTALMVQAAALGAFNMSVPKQIVLMTFASTLFYVAGFALQEIIRHAWRQGQGINVTVNVMVSPNDVVIERQEARIVVPRDDAIAFTTLEHREGRQEQRDEQRVGHPLGYSFRDAWVVWLQCGHRFEMVAAVAEEASARAIVRHLQDADIRAVRGGGQQDAFGRRVPMH
jgi:hypothetical protein